MQSLQCPCCGKQAENIRSELGVNTARGTKTYSKCNSCSSFFLVENYDVLEEAEHTATNTSWGKKETGIQLNDFKNEMFESVLALLKKYCAPPATILDIGCSYGGFLVRAQQQGYSVCGYDIVQQAVDYVNDLGIHAERCCIIDEFQYCDGKQVDIISSLDCSCYWPNIPLQLEQIHNKLRPGGYLVMRVPDKSWMISMGRWLKRFSEPFGNKLINTALNDHRTSLPVASLLKIIKGSGFEVVYASPQGALHSKNTRLPVKLCFSVGIILNKLTGVFLAPGALILARKPGQ